MNYEIFWTAIGSVATIVGIMYTFLRNFKKDIKEEIKTFKGEMKEDTKILKEEIKEIRSDINDIKIQISKLETRLDERTLNVRYYKNGTEPKEN